MADQQKQKLNVKRYIVPAIIVFLCCCIVGISMIANYGKDNSVTYESTEAVTEVTSAPEQTKDIPTAPPQPTAKLNLGIVGAPQEERGIALTVISVSTTDSISLFTPETGNKFLVLEVLIENVSYDGEAPYNPLYFTVKDSDGYEYNITIATPDPSLQSGDLLQGEKVRGFIAFEIRENATGLILTYEPIVILGGYKIRIDLGQ